MHQELTKLITKTFRSLRWICVAASLSSGGLLAAASASTLPVQNVFTAADIFKLKSVSEVEISPDGRWVAYTQRAGDVTKDRDLTTLWIVPATGGTARQLVTGEASHPSWSPDGDHIAYIAGDPGEKPQVQVVSRSTGARAQITHVDRSPGEIAWSPDGRSIAFTAFVPGPKQTLAEPLDKPTGADWAPPLRFTTAKYVFSDGSGYVEPGHTRVFVVSASGGPVSQLTFGPGDDGGPSWNPDGAALVYSSYDKTAGVVDFKLHRIYEVDVASKKVTRRSPEPFNATAPAVSPDGRHVAFIGWFMPHPGDRFPIDVYVMDRDGSHAYVLDPSLDREAESPRWTPDGRAVLFRYVDRGEAKIARAGLDDGSFRVLAQGAVDGFSASRDGVLAFPLGSADRPTEAATAKEGRVLRLTRVNAPLLGGLALATLRPLPVRSSWDGAEVGAWVLLPPGYDPRRRYPTILQIHGGPYGEDDPYWRTDSQVFAAAGYVVLYANYRGSTSYGLKFSTPIDRNFPSAPPYDDLMSAVDAAVAAGIADPSRLYAMGGSAGGEMTAWIVGRTHRFQAVVAQKPVIDHISDSLITDQYAGGAVNELGTTPWSDPMLFWKLSPLSLVANVTTPTLLVVGDKDRRTPLDEALEFYDALQIRGVPTGLVIVPGASHEGLLDRLSQRAEQDLDVLAWFARYPGPEHADRRLQDGAVR